MSGNRIILKKSYTPGEVPQVADLLPGELAYNIADGKLYALKGDISTDPAGAIDEIKTPYINIIKISDSVLQPEGHYEAKITVSGDHTAWLAEHDRVKVIDSSSSFNGLFYVLDSEYDGGENETSIVIQCEDGTGGAGGELRKYGEIVNADVVYTLTGPLDVDMDGTIKIENSPLYSGVYTVVSHNAGAMTITVRVSNYGDEGDEGAAVSTYDYEIVTFFSTSESLRQELIESVVDAIDVQMQRNDPDDTDKVTSVRIVRRDLQVKPGV